MFRFQMNHHQGDYDIKTTEVSKKSTGIRVLCVTSNASC